jgi:hypothetical protein
VDQLGGLGWVPQPEPLLLLLLLLLALVCLAASSCGRNSGIKLLLLGVLLLGRSSLCLPHHVLPVGAADGSS